MGNITTFRRIQSPTTTTTSKKSMTKMTIIKNPIISHNNHNNNFLKFFHHHHRSSTSTPTSTSTSSPSSPSPSSQSSLKSSPLLLTSSLTTSNQIENQKSNNEKENDLSIELNRLRQELHNSKYKIYLREQQLLKLNREIYRLRSILNNNNAQINYNDNGNELKVDYNNQQQLEKKKGVSGESLTATSINHDNDQQQIINNDNININNNNNNNNKLNYYYKDYDCRLLIQKSLMENSFLKNYLNNEQMQLIVDTMYLREFDKNCYICRYGQYGSHLFVINNGQCEVIDFNNKLVNKIGVGKAFGELALLYNCTRTASVKTLTKVRTWVLDRKVFQMIMMKTSIDRQQNIKQFLKKVPLLKNLNDEKIMKIADAVEVDYYPKGEYICRQGCFGDSFYIIIKGSVKVTKQVTKLNRNNQNDKKSSSSSTIITEEKIIRTLQEGDYFGEQALLLLDSARETLSFNNEIYLNYQNNDKKTELFTDNLNAVRTANVISEDCECLVLDQVNFFNLLGELQEIKYKSYTDPINKINNNKLSKELSNDDNNDNDNELKKYHYQLTNEISSNNDDVKFLNNLKLMDLKILTKLGCGGFGIVQLVSCNDHNDNQKVFAMKKCLKKFIRKSCQQKHIVNEKLVMQYVSGKNPFIIQLYRTFQDEQNVYFLMETALGGELWTVLRQRGPFNEQSVRFYVACVVEALQYLHSKNIIYRDLKPENCLLDSDGYLKLTDFGFSKYLRSGEKTWTFCGTPEYVAPEIILNRGHDKSVDIWALGILIYELLTGLPPFISNDPLQTYHIILRGFDSIGFDQKIFSKQCVNLIRNLCRENPNERLCIRGRNGSLNDIKRHKWYLGFNWNHLQQRKMLAPIVPKLTSITDTRNFDCINDDDFDDDLIIISKNNKNSTSSLKKSSSWIKSLSNCSGYVERDNQHHHFSSTTNNEKISSEDNDNYHLYNDNDSDWEKYF